MADAYNWPKLFKSHSITLVASQATYALPGDFSFYHWETFWNQSTQWKVYGAMSQQQFGENIGYGNLATTYDQFQIRGMTDSEITIYPTPGADTAGHIVTFQYTSARPVRPRLWTDSTALVIGAYVFHNGNYYTADSSFTTGASAPTHTTGSVGSLTFYSGEYQSFLADTDVCLLSERVLEQGVMERFASIKQLAVQNLFANQLEEEFGKVRQGKVLTAASSGRTRAQRAFGGIISITST